MLSQSEASSIIAFANYVSAKAQTIKHEKETQNKEEPDSHAARFVKKALGALQGLKTERCLGAQGMFRYLLLQTGKPSMTCADLCCRRALLRMALARQDGFRLGSSRHCRRLSERLQERFRSLLSCEGGD